MATYLTRTPASTTDAQRKTWTYSVWIKPSNILSSGNGGEFAWIYQASGGSSAYVRMDSNYKMRYRDYTNGGSPDYLRITDRLFRDPSAWYHVVLRNDTTQSTAADRVRLYVNGELQEWQNATQPAQDHIGFINSTFPIQIGESSSNALRGSYLSQVIMCAGQSYAPTVFGSTDANGIWVPNSQPSITYGTNGFKLDFIGTGASADASGFGADSSGNNNHFASTGLGTNPSTSDNPYNNFAVYNAVDTSSNITLSKGNTVATANSNHSASRASMGLRSGKWYWENKIDSVSGGPAVGVIAANAPLANQLNANPSRFYRNNGEKYSNGSGSSYGDTYTTGDIIGVALDMDNGALYFYKNGTIQNSGTAAFTDMLTATTEPWLPAVKLYNEGISINFGNPSYTIASGNADANGYGNFEYAVPSGYYALCTKNLAAYGG
mgnify:CR=1 FL=1